MAGSTTTTSPTHGSVASDAERLPHPITSNTYRVTIDVARIQANVFACEGGRLSELAIRTWLRSVGFTPVESADAQTWLADADSLCRLDKSEILRAERVPVG